MHRRLKELLRRAHGESKFVVAIVLDVRGFTSFAKIAESAEAAIYLKSAYVRILDEYFPDACFFKPTGDGLIVLLEYTEPTLREVVQTAVERSLALVEAFPAICADDPMVNFDVPAELGVGLARGAATRLVSGHETLDYSGRPLNVASRMNDLARPAGVVIPDSLGVALLQPRTRSLFGRDDKIYVRGLAETAPMTVHYTLDWTTIPKRNRRPLRRAGPHRQPVDFVRTRELAGYERFAFQLRQAPSDTDDIRFVVRHPDVTERGRPHRTIWSEGDYPTTYGAHGEHGEVTVDLQQIFELLTNAGVGPNWKIRCCLEYPLAEGS